MLCVSSKELSTLWWKSFLHLWQSYNERNTLTQAHRIQMNKVFANFSKEDQIYSLTTVEFSEAQWANVTLKNLSEHNAVIINGLEIKLIDNTTCVCKDGWLLIPKPLQVGAVKWYHHYLQQSGHTRLEVTMSATMYWKGMRTTIQSITRSCTTCQTNKRQKLKYGHLPPKTVISNPWECSCVNIISPYTLKGKDNLQIDLMGLTMIGPTFNWF